MDLFPPPVGGQRQGLRRDASLPNRQVSPLERNLFFFSSGSRLRMYATLRQTAGCSSGPPLWTCLLELFPSEEISMSRYILFGRSFLSSASFFSGYGQIKPSMTNRLSSACCRGVLECLLVRGPPLYLPSIYFFFSVKASVPWLFPDRFLVAALFCGAIRLWSSSGRDFPFFQSCSSLANDDSSPCLPRRKHFFFFLRILRGIFLLKMLQAPFSCRSFKGLIAETWLSPFF